MDSPARPSKTSDLDTTIMALEFQSDTKFSLSLSGLNLRMISGIGDMVCILNKTHFYELLLKNREIVNVDSIKQSERLVLYDTYGRTSFFYVSFGSCDVPIFHPGTIMFLSGVKKSCGRAKFDKEKNQMNDLILGPRDAIYLAAFITGLHQLYLKEISNEASLDSELFHKKPFERALKQQLEEFQSEDSESFGRYHLVTQSRRVQRNPDQPERRGHRN